MSTTGDRRTDLVRALNLLPYFSAHPGRSIFEAARDLGREPKELMADLDRLFCCGRPGMFPDDLVDMRKDYRRVEILNDQGLDKALRLTPSEAVALLMSLESLENVPGIADSKAVRSAAAKLRAHTGRSARGVADATPQGTGADADGLLRDLREAVAARRKVAFTYASLSSDTSRRRTVSPAHLFSHEGHTYLHALDGGEERTFRLDRMDDLEVTDEAAESGAAALDADAPFDFGPGCTAELELRESMAWLADTVPLELGEPADGWIPGRLNAGSREWLARFVLSHGDRLRVTGPPELVDFLVARRAAALAAYDDRQ